MLNRIKNETLIFFSIVILTLSNVSFDPLTSETTPSRLISFEAHLQI